MFTNILTVIQARTGSGRLPNKIMLPVLGEPILIKMVKRIKQAKLCGDVVVATTVLPEDDIIENLCFDHRIHVTRGHPTDLLNRHYKTALLYDAEVIIKIPSDCPLIDPGIIDRVVSYYAVNHWKFDFVSNLHPATYPDGNDVEIMSLNALKNAWKNARKDFEREHTTPYIWDNPHKFQIKNVTWEKDLDYSMTHRFTLDYKEDYEFIKTVFSELKDIKPFFTLDDILALLDRKPELMEINKKYLGVNWYRHNMDELKTIKPQETKLIQILN